ncbi:MAG: LysM peptidoglycan-binding domain-containing protein, partial [Actinomycetota bacterium]|nr:LysM peptidoglycan-binding domain-containing protein [Actinomycetota bacterium]
MAALFVVVVGIPAVLAAVSRITLDAWHPIPGIGSVDDIRGWLERRDLTSTEIAPPALRVLIALLWLLWVGLVMSLLSAIAAASRRLERLRLPRLAMFDGAATWVAAGLTALSSFAPNLASRAVAEAPTPIVEVLGDPTNPADRAVDRVVDHADRRPVPDGWARVQPGESIEMVAARTLGDPSRWTELWELNRDRPMGADVTWREPWRLRAGWDLELPEPSTPAARHERGSPSEERAPAEPQHDQPDTDDDAHTVIMEVPGGTQVPAEMITMEIDDTLWDRSVQHLAAHGQPTDPPAVADYLAEVVAANESSVADPDLIFPDQRVVLPSIPSTSGDTTGGVTPEEAVVVVHRVVDGDTVWDILQARLGYVDAELVWQVAAINGLGDPTMIYPGMELEIPSLLDTPERRSAVGERERRPDRDPHVDDGHERRDRHGQSDDRRREPVDREQRQERPGRPDDRRRDESRANSERRRDVDLPPVDAVPPAAIPPADPLPPAVETAPPTTAPAAANDDDRALFDSTTRTVWWRIPMGLLLAAGLVTMVRRLRGRRVAQLRVGERLAAPPPVAAGTELAAAASGEPVARLTTLRSLLRSVTPHAREHDDPPAVRAVELDETRIEVLFSAPAPFPPAGWATVDGGRSWVRRLADASEVPVRQLLTPALVSIGRRRDGGELLLDLETAGSLGLTGDRAAALGLARSMVLELATYPLGIPMDLCLVGLEVDGLEHCDRSWGATTLVRAVRAARETLERTTATGATSLTAARAACDVDEALLDPQIFVVDSTTVDDEADVALLAELIELCQPQAGAALIVVGDHPTVLDRVYLDPGGVARWSGAEVTAPVVDREAAAQVAMMFDHAANTPSEPVAPSPAIADLIATANDDDDTGDSDDVGHEDDGGYEGDTDRMAAAVYAVIGNGESIEDETVDDAVFEYREPDHTVTVRLLGEVTVEGCEIRTALDVEMLALLVCMRDGRPNIDTITAMLGRDSGHRAMQTRMSKLRVRLGVDDDGNDLLPRAAVGRNSPGRYQVSTKVLTDVELIEHRYHTALELPSGDALEVLRGGLALFGGPAFRARKGYDWAYPE